MSCSLRPSIGFLQRRQRIAAGVDEIVNARGTEGCFLFARAPCQIDMACSGGLKGLCGGGRMPGVNLVGRAQTGQRRARSLEGGRERSRGGKNLGIDRPDPAGLKKTLLKWRPCGGGGWR